MTKIQLKRKYKRVVQLELNELSRPIIDALVSRNKLPHFARINQEWGFYETTSENTYEKWEPWIQWVTAHTGKPLSEHNVFRLSDGHTLRHKQTFEVLSERGIESGIVGSMNTVRGTCEGGFFLPDPWTKKGETYPSTVQPLWNLLSRFVQKRTDSLPSMRELAASMQACLRLRLSPKLYLRIVAELLRQKTNPLTRWRLPSIFDLFLTEIFKRLVTSTNFGFYTLFLNSVAHYQHHYWRNFDKTGFDPTIRYDDCRELDDPVSYGYQLYDRILGEILNLADQPDTLIIIASGLSQVPFRERDAEGGMNYYRLRNHQQFVQSVGLSDLKVYSLMSRDWEIGSEEPARLEHAKKVLSGLKVANEPLFNVKQGLSNLLFVETAVTRRVAATECILDGDGESIGAFDNAFKNIAVKSGHHTGIGCLWISEKTPFEPTDSPSPVPLTFLHDLTLQALSSNTGMVARV